MANHLFDFLSVGYRHNPSAIFCSEANGTSTSYKEFFGGALRIAGILANLGVGVGDRVAVKAQKSLSVLQLYIGTVAAGGAILPINPAATAAETEYFLRDASPRLLICKPEEQPQLAAAARNSEVGNVRTLDGSGKGTLLAHDEHEVPGLTPVQRQPHDLAAILYTSGTTGSPKGAMLSHGALVSNSATLKDLWRFTADDVLIHFLPVNHVHGLFVATNVALMACCQVLLFQKFDAEEVIEAMPRATAMMGVPTHYTRLLAHPKLSVDTVAGMRLFVSGSAPLLASTHQEWERRTGHRILERYGMTEANMITSHSYEGPRKAGSVGSPIPDVSVRIRQEGGSIIARRGEIGVLEVQSPGLFSGYWGMPEKTAEDMRPGGWFSTGDFARYDSDGEIVLEGRAKDLVISGGVNIYPKEIEIAIDSSPEVTESAVVGLPHPDFGEAVVAFVVGSNDCKPSPGTVLSQLGDKLARYKHPKRVIIVERLPRNSMGKVQKSVLRNEFSSLFSN